MPVAETMRRVSSTEFACWQHYFQKKKKAALKKRHKWEHYAAQLTAAVVKASPNCTHPRRIKDEHYFFDYQIPGEAKEKKSSPQTTTTERAMQLKMTKNRWAGMLGTTMKDLKRKK